MLVILSAMTIPLQVSQHLPSAKGKALLPSYQYVSIPSLSLPRYFGWIVWLQTTHILSLDLSIVKRTGLPKGVVRDWLEVLKKEDQVVSYNVYLDRYFVYDKFIKRNLPKKNIWFN